MLCMFGAIHSDQTTYITIGDTAEKIWAQDELKILGFIFGTKPNANAHIEKLMRTFRCRLWLLRRLKQADIENKDMLKLYKVIVLPVLDHAAVIYHSLLTNEQTNALEGLQSSALKIIYGFKMSYDQMMENAGLTNLYERRVKLVKTIKSPRFQPIWFPKREFIHHNLRRELIFEEKFAKTNRLYNSPLYFMRRRLNEAHLKVAQDELEEEQHVI